MNLRPLVLLAWVIAGLVGCDATETPEDPMTTTPYDFRLPPGVAPPPQPEGAAVTVERATLGRRLFYDPRLSRDASISCASCHLQEAAFADHHPISIGIEGRIGFRNSPTLVNVGYHPYYFREGGNPTLEGQAFGPIEEHAEMDYRVSEIVKRLSDDEALQQLARRAYGRPLDAYSLIYGLGAFQRTIISADAPYDRYRFGGDAQALSPAEKRGLALFESERLSCNKCHTGFDLSTYAIVNNGAYAHYADEGLARITQDSADVGKFKIPTLKNIALTYPYMHDGAYPTLESVIEHYNRGGYNHRNQSPYIRPLNLTAQEKADLLAFLHSLTDQTLLHDPRLAQ